MTQQHKALQALQANIVNDLPPAPNTKEKANSGRREIVTTGKFMREVSDQALAVLKVINEPDPFLFQRGSTLVRLQVSEGSVSAEPLTHPVLKGILDRAADFVRVNAEGESTPTRPPGDVVSDILALPNTPLPPLTSILGCPTYLRDGSLLAQTGYHAPSGLYLCMNGLYGIRDDMSLEEARVLLLEECLGDFPFDDEGSKAHAVAAMLQPFVRELIAGPTPLYLIDAPARGTGKGLVANVIASVTLGYPAYVMGLPGDEDEVDKRITSILLASHPVILLDNVTSLKSSSLSAALTTELWQGRRLGKSEMVRVPNRALWMATGNNVALSDEITRRSIPIRLDAQVEQPELRTGFRHGDLLSWVLEHRGELVSACLSLVRAWIYEGMPKSNGTLGRFESWVQVVGGVLEIAGVSGFLSNRDRLYQESDHDTREWMAFVDKWWERFNGQPVTAKDLFEVVKENSVLMEIWAGRSPLAAQQRIGHALASRRDRIFGKFRLRSAGRSGDTGSAAYCLDVRPEQGGMKTPETPVTSVGIAKNENAQGVVLGRAAVKTPSSRSQNPTHDSDTKVGVSGVSVVLEAPQSAEKEGRV